MLASPLQLQTKEAKFRFQTFLSQSTTTGLAARPLSHSWRQMEVLEQRVDTSARHEKQEEEGVQVPEGGRSAGGEAAAVSVASALHSSAFVDHNIQYQFHPDSSSPQLTYRVVQVTDRPLVGGEAGGGAVGVVSTAAFSGAQQAVIQSPFSNEGGPAAEAMGGEPRFAYLPAAVSDAAATGVSLQPSDPALSHTGGQFYVMMTTPDVLQPGAPRSIAPRTHPYAVKMEGPRTPRDERRRAQHNEVERRRRDKINNWIVTLSKIIPDCNMDSTKTGASKGGILSKACDYIQELRQHNHRLQESLKEVKRVQMDNEILRQQVDELKSENALLRAQLQPGGGGEPLH
ncbi:upstream stimulatory factor 2 isoform X2 [Colossoma macropomum]|uniref:upstream stimulatory factor 2 isoform X2 n=1 Tax=Colossoma macropomum TaxID=42526 RepID=UPI001864C45B|nr:upstream stimulatory factor 2 isoform X2 [Colossoma macropomum]